MKRHPNTNDTRKLLSQNFLTPGPLVEALVADTNIGADDLVVEIGGGSGVLSGALEATRCRMVVLEKDPRYSGLLAERFHRHPRVKVVAADAREFRWPSERFRVFANLPYGLTTEILRILLQETGRWLTRADLIVQLEVARKRARPPQGNKLNLVWAPWWRMRLGRHIPAEHFRPKPKVDSAMLVVERREPPLLPWQERRLWHGLLEHAFEEGRQPVGRALRGVLTGTQIRRAAAGTALQSSTVVSKLTLDDWLRLHAAVRDHVPESSWPRSARRKARQRALAPQLRRRVASQSK